MRRKSNSEKMRAGTARPDRMAKEVKLDGLVIPECPMWLDDTGKQTWQRVTEIMSKANISFDVELLAIFCDTYSHSIACSKRLRSEGYTMDTATMKKINPGVNALREMHKTLSELGKLLGLSAEGRSKLGIELEEEEPDPLEEFLRTGKVNPSL